MIRFYHDDLYIFKQRRSIIKKIVQFFKNFFVHQQIAEKKLSFFVYYTIFLFFLFLIAFSLMLATLIRIPTNVQTPDFSFLFVTEALETTTKQKLNVRILSSFHSEIPRGYIISQKPEPGMTTRVGRRITLIVSKGPSMENIPSLIGQTISQAKSTIYALYAKYGYTPSIIEQAETSLEMPIGSITKQFPQAGNSMSLETPIVLVMSEGKLLLNIPMEDYVGKHYKKVVQQLESLRISVILKEIPTTETNSIGIILKQSIAPQEILQEGDKIILSVGTGEKISSVQTKKSIHIVTIPYNPHDPLLPQKNLASLLTQITKNFPSQKLSQWTTIDIFLQDSISRRKIYHNTVLCGEKIYIPYTSHGNGNLFIFTNGQSVF